MKRDAIVNINPITFPGQLATDAEKATDEFGLQIGQAIQYEWFRRDGSSCRYYNQWVEFHRLRLYARGEQLPSRDDRSGYGIEGVS
jgi:hypothetical protein